MNTAFLELAAQTNRCLVLDAAEPVEAMARGGGFAWRRCCRNPGRRTVSVWRGRGPAAWSGGCGAPRGTTTAHAWLFAGHPVGPLRRSALAAALLSTPARVGSAHACRTAFAGAHATSPTSSRRTPDQHGGARELVVRADGAGRPVGSWRIMMVEDATA
ncbi:hypothetical protein QJS66_09620 [Kocuria rhizophila]|nr:hypothetical protein QJS66_09620 [Kocuria rhizophila]